MSPIDVHIKNLSKLSLKIMQLVLIKKINFLQQHVHNTLDAMLPLSKRKAKFKESCITSPIKNAGAKKHKLLNAYQNQGNLEAKQKLRQHTVKVKKW